MTSTNDDQSASAFFKTPTQQSSPPWSQLHQHNRWWWRNMWLGVGTVSKSLQKTRKSICRWALNQIHLKIYWEGKPMFSILCQGPLDTDILREYIKARSPLNYKWVFIRVHLVWWSKVGGTTYLRFSLVTIFFQGWGTDRDADDARRPIFKFWLLLLLTFFAHQLLPLSPDPVLCPEKVSLLKNIYLFCHKKLHFLNSI